jgi:helicase MOV-10
MELGLGQSYLERLMSLDAYDLKSYYAKRYMENTPADFSLVLIYVHYFSSVVKLTKNFRSHRSHPLLPNERFYNGDLEQCADPSTINCFLNSFFSSIKAVSRCL